MDVPDSSPDPRGSRDASDGAETMPTRANGFAFVRAPVMSAGVRAAEPAAGTRTGPGSPVAADGRARSRSAGRRLVRVRGRSVVALVGALVALVAGQAIDLDAFSGPVNPTPGSQTAAVAQWPADLVAGPVTNSLVTPGAVTAWGPATRPPKGAGRVVTVGFTAPWSHGSSSVQVTNIYLPPGYSGTKTHLPVLYEAPYGIGTWNNGIGVVATLNRLITSGTVPPMIVVFASASGGPYLDSECADSYDGREHFDTFMATTLVKYVDSHYRTIARAAGRALMGISQGGYCSAALWSHHPGVFGSTVSWSGYFISGIKTGTTPYAALPFGNNAKYEAAQSPMKVVPGISASLRGQAFVIMSADPSNKFYGVQMHAFANVLDAAHVPLAVLPSALGHSWQTVQVQFQTVLDLLGSRMVTLGAIRQH